MSKYTKLLCTVHVLYCMATVSIRLCDAPGCTFPAFLVAQQATKNENGFTAACSKRQLVCLSDSVCWLHVYRQRLEVVYYMYMYTHTHKQKHLHTITDTKPHVQGHFRRARGYTFAPPTPFWKLAFPVHVYNMGAGCPLGFIFAPAP